MKGDIKQRSLEIFKHIVDAYMETGEPIGSAALSNRLNLGLSPATIRNVMAQLEREGFLRSPHTSGGRFPTERGLQFFVNGFLEQGELSPEEKEVIEKMCEQGSTSYNDVLIKTGEVLSGLSSCASLVLAPKKNARLKHLEFVILDSERALVIIVTMDGAVENRVVAIPKGIPLGAFTEATNFINANFCGKSLSEVRKLIQKELSYHRAKLDDLAQKIVEAGVATWAGPSKANLLVHGQSNLLNQVQHINDLENIKSLFSLLEEKENAVSLIDAAIEGDGVQIFIGAESELFTFSGCSMVISPYKGKGGDVIGAIGVIGPNRMNYSQIIPMIDYTSKIISKLIG